MARPERNNVDYFPHPVKHGKKMFYIRKKYGNDGYTVWNMLLEKLGDANFHYLDLNEQYELMYLYSEFDVTEEKLIAIITDLIKLDEFDKEFWEKERILFNQKFTDSIHDAYSKRRNNCITRNQLIELLEEKGRTKPDKLTRKPDKCISTVPINPQSRVENSIEKENKLKESISYNKDDYFTSIVEIFYWKNYKHPIVVAEKFWNHYQQVGWVNAKGNPITDPLAAAKNWKNTTTEGKNCSETIIKKWQIAYNLIKAQSPDHYSLLLELRAVYVQRDSEVVFKGPEMLLHIIRNNTAFSAVITQAFKTAFGDKQKYRHEPEDKIIAA